MSEINVTRLPFFFPVFLLPPCVAGGDDVNHTLTRGER